LGRPSKYPDEFKRSAVEMVRESGKPIAEVARSLGMNEGTLGNWVMADRRRRGDQPSEKVSESERAELLRLRRENAELRMEKEILKKAAAFFVTESTR
jgi:transposase